MSLTEADDCLSLGFIYLLVLCQ